MIQVLFVCLGNICRSPMAEAVFKHMVDQAGLSDQIKVDSAGTGSWHVGEPAHMGTRRVLRDYGIDYTGRARQIIQDDLQTDTYIIVMDESNLREIQRRFRPHARLHRLLDFAEELPERDVPDPYYTGNFEYVYQLVVEGCAGLLAHIRRQENI